MCTRDALYGGRKEDMRLHYKVQKNDTIYYVDVKSLYPYIRGLLEKYPTFGREKETGLLGALDT